MLHVFRESFGRYVAIAILALIALTFVFFGIDFSVSQSSFAAKVNGESIPIAEFDRTLRQEQTRIQSLILDEFTDDMRREIRRVVIDEMVMRELLVQRAMDAGYRISDARILESIQADPSFHVGGQFSQDVYLSLLTSEGLSPAGFELEQRELQSVREMQGGLLESSFITPAEFRRNIELFYERRQIAYAMFASADFLEQVEVGDEQVAEYHAANGDLFMTEEAVDLELVELDLARIAETIEISDTDLLAYYEAEVERYAVSEERQVSHILIEPDGDDYEAAEAEVAAVMARLDAGEDFAALASEVSDDVGTRNLGGELGWMARGVLEGPFEDALFAMGNGETRGPVETEFGYHILRLQGIRAGEQQPFEQVRDQLREELAADAAYSTFYDRANDLANDAYDARNELQGVAEAYGLELQTIDGLTRSANTGRFENPAPVLAYAFDDVAIATGENSDLIELSDERVAVIRVALHRPPEPRLLEDIAEDIRAILAQQNAADLAREAATRYYDALQGDDSGDLLAYAASTSAENGATWNGSVWVERDSTDVPAAIVSLAFAQSRPVPGSPLILRAPTGDGDEAIVLLSAVEAGVPDDISVAEREQGQEDLRTLAAEFEFNSYATDARQRTTVRVPDEILDPQF